MPWGGPRLARKPRDGRFRGGKSMPAFVMASISTSCTSSGDALRPPLCEQVGGKQRCFVPLLLPDTGDQCVRRWIGQLVEAALQGGGRRLGIEAGRGDTLVSEEALQISDVHAERKQAGRHRVAQQMRIDALADPGGNGGGADDLAHPLARQHVWRWTRTFLAADEQRPGPPRANVQPKQLRRIGTSRRFPPLPWRMVTTRSARPTSSTRSCTSSEALAPVSSNVCSISPVRPSRA